MRINREESAMKCLLMMVRLIACQQALHAQQFEIQGCNWLVFCTVITTSPTEAVCVADNTERLLNNYMKHVQLFPAFRFTCYSWHV